MFFQQNSCFLAKTWGKACKKKNIQKIEEEKTSSRWWETDQNPLSENVEKKSILVGRRVVWGKSGEPWGN